MKFNEQVLTACLAFWFRAELVQPKLERNGFGCLCLLVGLIVQFFFSSRTSLRIRAWMGVRSSFLRRREPISFFKIFGFGCFQKAFYIKYSIIVIIVQKGPCRNRVSRFIVFRLFIFQYQKICYMHPFFKCLWMIQKIAALNQMFVVLLFCAGEIRRYSSHSRSCEGWIMPVTSLSVWVCDSTQFVV